MNTPVFREDYLAALKFKTCSGDQAVLRIRTPGRRKPIPGGFTAASLRQRPGLSAPQHRLLAAEWPASNLARSDLRTYVRGTDFTALKVKPASDAACNIAAHFGQNGIS